MITACHQGDRAMLRQILFKSSRRISRPEGRRRLAPMVPPFLPARRTGKAEEEDRMNHGGILLLMLFPWVTSLLVAFAIYEDRGFPPFASIKWLCHLITSSVNRSFMVFQAQ